MSTTYGDIRMWDLDEAAIHGEDQATPWRYVVEMLKKGWVPPKIGPLLVLTDARTTGVARPLRLYSDDVTTFRHQPLRLSEQGWVLARRLSETVALAEQAVEDNEDLFVEPPDESLWHGLPKSRW